MSSIEEEIYTLNEINVGDAEILGKGSQGVIYKI